MESASTFQHKLYTYTTDLYKQQNIIWIDFTDNNGELLNHLKKFVGKNLSEIDGRWYVPNNGLHRTLFRFDEHELKRIPAINKEIYQQFVDELYDRGYKMRTIKTYSNEFNHFLRVFKKIRVDEFTDIHIRSYLYYCTAIKKNSTNLIHSRVNAMKVYYEEILGKTGFMNNVPRPQKVSEYSNPFTLREVEKMIEKTKNKKHKLLLIVCYGLGLRVSEIVHIKYSDIDKENMRIRIDQGKGTNPYYVNLPETILDEINAYRESRGETLYLFEGSKGGQYSIRAVQKVFSDAMKRINKNLTIGLYNMHKPYSTQLIERGIDMDFVEKYISRK